MRSPVSLAAALPLAAFTALGIAALAACGGPAFTSSTTSSLSDASALFTSDAAAPTFCATDAGTHTFCDDFDGLPLTSLWTDVVQKGGVSTLSMDTAAYSPPNALKALTDTSTGLTTYQARVYKSFGTASRVVVDFALHIDAVGPKPLTGGDSFADISLGSGYVIALVANTDNVSYTEEVTPLDAGVSTAQSSKIVATTSSILSRWTNVKLDLDVRGQTITVSINGVVAVPATAISPPSGLPTTIYIGTRARNITSPVAGHYDNVTIDITP